MKRITDALRRVRSKLARITGALAIAERRIKHHARVHSNAPKGSARRKRAGRYLVRWIKRRNWLLGKKRHLDTSEQTWLKRKRAWQKAHPAPTQGWTTWGGVAIPAWMEPWLEKSKAAGWSGYVTSGIRTPEHSVALCEAMCGAASCPGRCAGATSNHNCSAQCPYPTGAIDVTDYSNFERIQYEVGSPLRNNLPIDPVHFSVSGY